ncbi:nucleotidyl-sugar pyranose mutase [Paraflavitalea soli]|uniref:Nucleotidyl-sugar pyranose mutase n=1 Tax=Paraflavitalea soli TaxID=2315862 RepID=A0A3B7MMM0_9BACT|nr:NAD(P)-binding protein [Paraflavitalea soli]AXY74553.1 nucleotidyl-sugar pyranose mutase [Paraflavitalea soli]
MKRIGVLGAGIAGCSFAKLAAGHFDVEILERNQVHGGIARTRTVEGVTWHPTGGHCFNSKYPEVLRFVFEQVLSKDQWHSVQRRAVIKLLDHEVLYPIEFAVKQIHAFAPDLALNITKDFLNAVDDRSYASLEDWFRKMFGHTLAEAYFIPYNTKIWNRHPREMSPAWVEGKLPLPDKQSFFKGLIGQANDQMPHASFYYPNSNDQNTFIDALADGLNIEYGFNVNHIHHDKSRRQWIVNGSRTYDMIVSTLPLDILPGLITGTPPGILEMAGQLRYNKVTTMLWETMPTNNTWTYIPSPDSLFHRYIHIGSFFSPARNFSIIEAVGEISRERMVKSAEQDPFLIRPLDYHVSDHAYVVFDENYAAATQRIQAYLQQAGMATLGRFGEWQYYNMDVCIKRSMDLVNQLKQKMELVKEVN